ncbi:MAG: hypothetical protein GY862_00490 [Gammaproteobacteria bacterium]|nr:hypothetical protein [Gammaproteobacteria bacterium]
MEEIYEIVDIYEFIGKMAAQNRNLLKVIELQNSSIQTLNQRMNAMAASQLIVFSLLLESQDVDRGQIAQHLQLMLENPNIAGSEHLVAQLRELLDICGEPHPKKSGGKSHPDWFRGVVQGGLSEEPPANKCSKD